MKRNELSKQQVAWQPTIRQAKPQHSQSVAGEGKDELLQLREMINYLQFLNCRDSQLRVGKLKSSLTVTRDSAGWLAEIPSV